MALKTAIEKLEDVDESVREHYVETKDPKTGVVQFVLGLDGSIDPLPQVKALRTENGSYRIKLREADAVIAKLKPFDGMDPTEILAKLDRVAELEVAAGGKLDAAGIDALVTTRIATKLAPIERARDAALAENVTLKDEVTGFRTRDKVRLISDSVRSAAVTLKMQPEAVDDAILLAERIMEVGEDSVVSVKDKVGYTPGLDVKSWLQDMQSKRPHWWGPSAGGGARGGAGFSAGGGNNPWSHEHWNVSEQNVIYRADAKRAETMATSAGTKLGGTKPAAKK